MFLVIFIFALFFNYAQLKIGYIDKEIVLKQMPEYKKVEDEYKSYEKLYADTLQAENLKLYRSGIFPEKI